MIRWCLLTWILLSLGEIQTAKKPRVFNGTVLRYDKHKYLVKILPLDLRGMCSGSIINSMTVLTAAHCFNRFSNKFIILHYTKKEYTNVANVTQEGVIIHPNYDQRFNTRHVDLAIMKTEENMQFDECIRPIALAMLRGVQVSDKAIIAGYGRSDPNGLPSAREGNVIITNCPKAFQRVICTLDYVRAGSGDSGGALVFRRRLVGVTSGSCINSDRLIINNPCLTVYANVTENIDWIMSHITTTEIVTSTSEVAYTTTELQRQPSKKYISRLKTYNYDLPPILTTFTPVPPTYIHIPEDLPTYYLDEMSRTNFTYIII